MTLATDKQVSFAQRLISERPGCGQDAREEVLASMSRQSISALIDRLLAMPKQRQDSKEYVSEPGMYRVGDTFYKVQKARDNGGYAEPRLYAKRLVVEGFGSVRFVYAPGAMREISPEDRMTLEDAKAFGVSYGTCCVCGRVLTNATSIAEGIGPVCSGRV